MDAVAPPVVAIGVDRRWPARLVWGIWLLIGGVALWNAEHQGVRWRFAWIDSLVWHILNPANYMSLAAPICLGTGAWLLTSPRPGDIPKALSARRLGRILLVACAIELGRPPATNIIVSTFFDRFLDRTDMSWSPPWLGVVIYAGLILASILMCEPLRSGQEFKHNPRPALAAGLASIPLITLYLALTPLSFTYNILAALAVRTSSLIVLAVLGYFFLLLYLGRLATAVGCRPLLGRLLLIGATFPFLAGTLSLLTFIQYEMLQPRQHGFVDTDSLTFDLVRLALYSCMIALCLVGLVLVISLGWLVVRLHIFRFNTARP
jgi:hypothetical protein